MDRFVGYTWALASTIRSRNSLIEAKPSGVVVAARRKHREVHVHAVLLSTATTTTTTTAAAAAKAATASRHRVEARGYRQHQIKTSTYCTEASTPWVEVEIVMLFSAMPLTSLTDRHSTDYHLHAIDILHVYNNATLNVSSVD